MKRWTLGVLAVAAALTCAAPATADAYSNGQLPGSALAPIYNPQNAPHQVLAKAGGAAAAWNTLNLGLWQSHKPMLFANGDGAAYRCLACSGFSQRYAYAHSPPGYAAYPGTSRHGLGWALDLYSPSWSRPLLDRYGPALSWSWGWVPYEDWHVEFHGRFTRPDPGVSPAHPYLAAGSGGRYQATPVAVVQRRLQRLRYFPHHAGGSYNAATRAAVFVYQVARGFRHPSGSVTRNTWLALRQPQAGRKTAAASAHAVAKLAGLRHGSRGPAVAQLARDLAFVRYHARPSEHFYHGPAVQFFTVGLAGALKAWQLDNRVSGTGVYDVASQRLMGTSLRYWHRRFPTKASPSPDHPAPAPAPKPAPSGSSYWTDISGNNASVNLTAYKASRHVLIATKATEGDGFRSDSFIPRWKRERQLGLVRIAYDFARPSQNSCTAEADNFAHYVRSVGWYRGDIAALDWEDDWNHNGDGWVRCYARRLAVDGVRLGIIYANGYYSSATLTAATWRSGYGLWHAQYSGSVSSSTASGASRGHLVAIQYTDGVYGGGGPKSFPGIGEADGDKLTVSLDRLLAYAQK